MKNKQFPLLLGITITTFALSAWAASAPSSSSADSTVPVDQGGNLTLAPAKPAQSSKVPAFPPGLPSGANMPADSTMVMPPPNMQQGQMPPQGMPSDQMPPQGMPSGQMPPQGMPSGQMPPQGMPSGQMPSQGMPSGQMPPQGMPSGQMPPQSY